MKKIIAVLSVVLLWSCAEEKKAQVLENGTYRAVLTVQDDKELPFIFEVDSPTSFTMFNAEEAIEITDITYKNDSIYIKNPVFEGYFAAVFEGKNLKGEFIKESLERYVPFTAEFENTTRFTNVSQSTKNSSGIWEMVFSKDIEGDEYIAKGIFEQNGDKVTGTIRTTTGDYRYLEGVMDDDELKLSTFDGAHAFLFTAKVTDSTLEGSFYSGNHWKEPFIAKRNETYELPDANTLTFLKDGYDRFEFSFPDASGNMVSLSDERFKDKAVVVQIMGTWCPNCLEESKYYTQFYDAHKDKAIEFVALAFEYAKTKEKAFAGIERLRTQLDIKYPILLAQYETEDKAKANEKLPMLNHVLSYPTTIFIDKIGEVRRIHTGFNGEATGKKYTEFKTEFESFVAELLAE